MVFDRMIGLYTARKVLKEQIYSLLRDANEAILNEFDDFPYDSFLAQRNYEQALELAGRRPFLKLMVLHNRRKFEKALDRMV